MIVLDTNVVSGPFKPKPSPTVLHWLDAQEPQTLYITSVTSPQLLFGVASGGLVVDDRHNVYRYDPQSNGEGRFPL